VGAGDATPLRAEDKAGDLRGVLPAGTSLRGYELKSILGQGAFGITYRARDLNLDREVAIKEYLPTSLALREGRTTVLPRSPDHAEQFAWGRERFLEEARTLARLDRTPAIVRVHDFLEDNGTAYMVMALIEGETLAKRLMRERQLTAEAVERILFPLLDGLEEVHGIGFLHRDIKPANIMIDRAGRPTLIDFGASRAAMAERSQTMTAIFTPGYAAAEQFTSATLGPWTDIYGLAATMYHAISGAIPPSAIDRILKDEFAPLAELQPEGFAPELRAGLDAGLAIRAEERPQNLAQWRHALRSGERPVPSIETTRIERRPRRTRKGLALRGPALWGAAAAAVLLVGGAGWLAWRAEEAPTVGEVVQTLSAEQLEQALAERRKADSLAAEKRRLEDEARHRAEAEAEAKRQAEAELQRAREDRQKAEQELAELKERIATSAARDTQRDQQAAAEQRAREEEAQHQAEAQAAALRAAEQEAQKKADADAEAKRRADEALAAAETERRRAEQEAEAKVAAEKQAMQLASEEAQRKAADAEKQKADAEAKTRADAEAAEKALRLEQPDRQRLQAALTALGFDTRGADGLIGPRSREMIAGWQKARKLAPTGFLDAAQRQQLLKEAEPALAKLDEKQKAEEEAAKARAILAAAARPAATPATGAATSHDGAYSGIMYGGSVKVALQLSRGAGTIALSAPGCEPIRFAVSASSDGAIAGKTYINCSFGATAIGANLRPGDFDIDGRIQGNEGQIWFRNPSNTFSLRMRRDRETSAVTRYDGTYVGRAGQLSRSWSGPAAASLRLQQGRGAVVIEVQGCGPSNFQVSISDAGNLTGEGTLNCTFNHVGGVPIGAGAYSVDGRWERGDLDLSFQGARTSFYAILRRGASAPRHPFDGTYEGTFTVRAMGNQPISIQLVDGKGEVSWRAMNLCNRNSRLRLDVTRDGKVTGAITFYSNDGCYERTADLSGKVENGTLLASFLTPGGGANRGDFELKRR
jgi:peptidoglycan hydrolase-like protein with peptidoglycan-binding domain